MEDEEFPADDDALNKTFKRAADFVTFNASSMTQDDLLYLYGRFKQANAGPCTEPIPSILRFRERSKWTAWHSLGDMGKEEAMRQYVAKLSDLNPSWDSNRPIEGRGKKQFGPVSSSLVNTDPELTDEAKTVFDFVKEGNVGMVRELINTTPSILSVVDDDGLSLLHWACDRGHCDIVSLLVSSGANVDVQDSDGQTPLHYASSCGHEGVVKMLIRAGASLEVFDSDGLTPADVAYNTDLKEALSMPCEGVASNV